MTKACNTKTHYNGDIKNIFLNLKIINLDKVYISYRSSTGKEWTASTSQKY